MPLRDIGHGSIVENQIQSAPYYPSTSGQFRYEFKNSLTDRMQAPRFIDCANEFQYLDVLRRRRVRGGAPIVDVVVSVKCSIVLRVYESERNDAVCDAPMSVGVVNGLCQWRTLCASLRNETQAIRALSSGVRSGSLSELLGPMTASPFSSWTWTITQGHAGGPPQRVLRSALA